MDNWEKLNKKSLPEKKDFYSHIYTEYINNADYTHPKRVCQDFEIKNLGEYHDLHVQGHTLLLANVFEQFQNMSWNMWPWPSSFFSTLGLAGQAALKRPK